MPAMLRYRLIYGPLMIAAMVALFWADNQLDQIGLHGLWRRLFWGRQYLPAGLVMLTLVMIVMPLASLELCAIFRAKGIEAHTLVVTLAGMLGCATVYVIPWQIDAQVSVAIIVTVVVLVFMGGLLQYAWHGRTQGAVAAGSATTFALIYTGFLPGFFLLIRRWHSAWLILGILIIIKSCDIGAYFTGRALGRHKLIPWLSPKKTWEGLIGGVLASTVVAAGLTDLAWRLQDEYGWKLLGAFRHAGGHPEFVPHHYPLWAVALAGALFGVVGQLGDLTASLFKRDAGIKDSGSYIPGFGGVLDLVDSPLGVAPVAYWVVLLLDHLSH